MQRSKHKVAGFGGLDRDRDGLEISHFADEQDIRIFAKCGTQRVFERVSVVVYLTLIDQTFLILVREFDRVFDRDDVILAVLVDRIDHRTQRR